MEGGEGQLKGNLPSAENPSSSALSSTVMVNGVLYHFSLRSSESTISDSLAPKSSHYVDLSAYPPGTDIEYERHWDGNRPIFKVPRWAHEKWLLKFQNADDTIIPQDTLPNETSTDAAAFSNATNVLKHPGEDLFENHPSAAAAAYVGGKRPCVDHPNSATATAASGTNPLKRPGEDLAENHPSATAATYGGKRPCEDHPNSASASATAASGAKAEDGVWDPFAYPNAYPVKAASAHTDFPGKYVLVVEDGRVVEKVDENAPLYIQIGGTASSKLKAGVYYPQQRVITVTKCKGI